MNSSVKTVRKSIIVLLFVLFGQTCLAQEDVSNYFDDGGISTPKHIIKPILTSFIGGDFSIGYEFVYSDNFTMEIGIGKINHYFELLFELDEFNFSDLKGGYSLRLIPKKYFLNDAPEKNYWGPMFRLRNYSFENKTIIIKEYGILYGVQFSFGKRFYLDYIVGFSWKMAREEKDSGTIKKQSIFGAPFSIAIGVGF